MGAHLSLAKPLRIAAAVLVFLTDADDEAGGHAVFPFARGEAEGTHAAGWLIIPSCKDALETALCAKGPACARRQCPTNPHYPYPLP